MANSFAYIEKTLPRVVDKVFAQESLTDRLIGKNQVKVDFLDARTVKVFKLASTGLTAYKRGGHGEENKRGSASSSTETFTLSQERYSEIPIDKLDSLDDGETVLGNQASEFIRTKVVPEFDAYRFSKLASYTSTTFGNRVEGTISANQIIGEFNKAFEWFGEQKVPEGNQIIFVSPATMTLIRNTTEIYKKLDQVDYKNGNITFTIKTYEGRPIVQVPSDEFFTDIQVGDGYQPTTTSKVINFLIVDKTAPIIVKKLDFAKVYDSTDENGAYLGFVGYLLTNLYYHDLFVPDNKRVGIYAHVSSVVATTKSRSVLADLAAGTSGKTLLKAVLTQPAGIMYDKIVLCTNASTTIGASTSSMTQITEGAEFTPNASHNIIVASLEDKVVAFSKDFGANIPKGA